MQAHDKRGFAELLNPYITRASVWSGYIFEWNITILELISLGSRLTCAYRHDVRVVTYSYKCKCCMNGQVENAEVRKRKYGNGSTEVRRKAASRCLVPYWLTLRPCSQRVTLSLWYESRILGSRPSASDAITMHVTASECGQTLTVSGPTMRALCSWCSRDSDADASVVTVSRWESSPMAKRVLKLWLQRHQQIVTGMRPRQDSVSC